MMITHKTVLQGSTGILPGPHHLKNTPVRSRTRFIEVVLWLLSVCLITLLSVQLYYNAFPISITGECQVIIGMDNVCTLYMVDTLYSSDIDCSTIITQLTVNGHYVCNYTEKTLNIGYYKSNILAFIMCVCFLVVMILLGIHLYIIN